jgi:hypothetical protein
MMVETLAFNGLSAAQQQGSLQEMTDDLISADLWTAPNLKSCYQALHEQGLLDVPAGEPRNLSESERLRVARLAQSGRPDQAIGFYLECALPDEEPTLEVLNNPDYRQVCDSAVWCVWETVTHDYTPTAAREAFLRRHCGHRPITLPLLNAAWDALKQREAGFERSEILSQIQQETPPPSIREIDALDDAAVDRLYHSTLRQYADQFRRTPGVLA